MAGRRGRPVDFPSKPDAPIPADTGAKRPPLQAGAKFHRAIDICGEARAAEWWPKFPSLPGVVGVSAYHVVQFDLLDGANGALEPRKEILGIGEFSFLLVPFGFWPNNAK
jgi:hypothetical protein